MVSTWLSPSFWQNLMQYCCSSCSVIFAENNNATFAAYTSHSHAGCTRLMLYAGGKKSTHAHEGTLHLPTIAHLPCFISFRGKKSRRILFEQASCVYFNLQKKFDKSFSYIWHLSVLACFYLILFHYMQAYMRHHMWPLCGLLHVFNLLVLRGTFQRV